MGRWIKRILLFLVAVGCTAAIWFAFQPQPILVDTAHATVGPLKVTVDEDGRTRIREKFTVSAPLTGRLQRIQLDPGDPVVAHQTVLAVIEPVGPNLLDDRARAEARARVKAAEAAVQRAESLVKKSEVAERRATSEMERVQRLSASSVATKDEVEDAELTHRAARQDQRAAVFSRDVAKFELQLAEAALVRSGEEVDPSISAEHLVIHAPVNGQVLRVPEKSMRVVQPGTPLLVLGDPADLEIEIDVLSTDAVKVEPGQEVIVEHWGGKQDLQAIVRLVEPSAFTKVSALGVEEQRVNVIADFAGEEKQRSGLGDGFRVEARIVVWSKDRVLQVPASCLFRTGNTWSVFVVESGVAKLRDVTIGGRTPLRVEIETGLVEGETVIDYPGDRFRDGAAVATRN